MNILVDAVELKQRLDSIVGFKGPTFNSVDTFHVDAKTLIENNIWRKAYLARYGRQSMLQWDDVPVSYMHALLHELAEILKKENEMSKVTEDG